MSAGRRWAVTLGVGIPISILCVLLMVVGAQMVFGTPTNLLGILVILAAAGLYLWVTFALARYVRRGLADGRETTRP